MIISQGTCNVTMSDHNLVFAIRKFRQPRGSPRLIETRDFRHFDENMFLNDLVQLPWDSVYEYEDPNDMWLRWKTLFLQVTYTPLCALSVLATAASRGFQLILKS